MDFNKLTLKRFRDNYGGWRDTIDRVMATRPVFVTIADAAKVRLPLNYKSYGLPSRDKQLYMDAFCKELVSRYGGQATAIVSRNAFMFKWKP